MVILHVACKSYELSNGVNVALDAILKSQEVVEEVALLNISDNLSSIINNYFLYKDYHTISNLPSPYNHPDIVIFHEIYHIEYISLYKYLVNNDIPYIILPHGGLTKKAQSKKKLKKVVANMLLFNKFIYNASSVQFLSNNEMINSIYKDDYFIIPNGISTIHNHNINPFDTLNIVYIGRFDILIKGLDLLLKAICLCKDELNERNCKFSLYGPNMHNNKKKLQKMINLYNIESLVSIKNEVYGKEKEEVLKSCDIFIQTSRTEGMPLGLLEALSYGIPSVATTGTSLTSIIDKYNAGWTSDTDVASLADCIKKAITSSKNEIYAKSLGAINLVKENFLLDKIALNTINEYKKIINK